MTQDLVSQLTDFLRGKDEVKFAYLFGSQAAGGAGPLSDVDIAVYLDKSVDFFHVRLLLMESLAKEIKSDRLDVVVLNEAPVLLKFEAIRNGVILKEDKPLRVSFETEVLREYLDTSHMREIQCSYLKERFRRG